jgi:hypothetical protein
MTGVSLSLNEARHRPERAWREERTMKRNTLTAVKALAAAALMTMASITIGMVTGARAEVAARYQANQWLVEAHTLNGAFNSCTISGTRRN